MKKFRAIIILLFIANIAFAQKLVVINSKFLKYNDSVLVFTPEKYKAKHVGTPALFLLHGWSGNYSNWSKKSDIQSFCNKYGFIIICPDGFYNSWYMNNSDTSKMQWRTFFDQELYPQIVKDYKLDPEKTFITGLSMGGQGAVNLFLDNPQRFKAAGSMSGVLNLQHTRLKTDEIAKVFGPYSAQNPRYDSESAVNRLENMKGVGKILLITCGAQDVYAKSASEFCAKADELKVPNILILSPGNHTWKYWDFALDMHLNIFNKILKGENLGY